MIIQSTRFGELDVMDTDIIKFPQGLLGFPEENAFVLIPHHSDSPFVFLQSVSEPNLTFIMLETLNISNEYEFLLDDAVLEELHLSPDNPPLVYNIVTTAEKEDDMTVNLLAPIIIDTKQRLAKQTVLEKVPYQTRHRIFPEGTLKKMKELQ
ncbi:flagellar assembly protein FliW [Pelosinus sp. sgz500959]|uniref:flagellar assembly protein FliW n=1 Tax=Pelosinus sp. sgz500959 TaxID=3242472 RepID=UPI003672DA19